MRIICRVQPVILCILEALVWLFRIRIVSEMLHHMLSVIVTKDQAGSGD